METEIIQLIGNATIPGAATAICYIVFKPVMPVIADWIRSVISNKPVSTNEHGEVVTLDTIDRRVQLLASNHFHEVKDSLDDIKDLLQVNNRAILDLKSSIEYIKGGLHK